MKIEERIIDFIYGHPTEAEALEMKKLLQEDEKVRELYAQFSQLQSEIKETPMVQPDQEWVDQFAQQIESKKVHSTGSGRVIQLSFMYKVAAVAAAIMIVGLVAINWNQRSFISHVDNELIALHQKMESTLGEQSVSARIKAVNYSEQVNDHNPTIVSLLSNVLLEDPSAHVRLAASEALSKWIENDMVRESLIQALKNEKDASVQISIITSLSQSLDESVRPHLDEVIRNENTLDFVKEEAEVSKFRMDNNLKIY